MGYPSDIPGMAFLEHMNELVIDIVGYQDDLHIIKRARWNDKIANELNRMTKKTANYRKGETVNDMVPVLIVAFPRDFETLCNVWNKPKQIVT